eukprot:3731374-Pleurochrysis_carterae.AAC.1
MTRRAWKPASRRRSLNAEDGDNYIYIDSASSHAEALFMQLHYYCSRRNPETLTPSRWSAASSGSSTIILPVLPHNTKDFYASSCQKVFRASAPDSRSTIWSTPT